MEIFNGDDSSEAFGGFCQILESDDEFYIIDDKNEGLDQDLLRFIHHTDTFIL